MTDPEAISKHFLRSEDQQWMDTYRTNVTAQYFMSMAFLPLLAKGREVTPGYTSQVVNVSSISGAMKGSSNGQFAYASSKAAFTHLSRMLATTFKDCKVRVNTIAPGIFPSEMTTSKSDEKNKSELSTQIGNPAGRGGHDSDMAATILFLAGPGGLFYNDQVMYPDGGEYACSMLVSGPGEADEIYRLYPCLARSEVDWSRLVCTNMNVTKRYHPRYATEKRASLAAFAGTSLSCWCRGQLSELHF